MSSLTFTSIICIEYAITMFAVDDERILAELYQTVIRVSPVSSRSCEKLAGMYTHTVTVLFATSKSPCSFVTFTSSLIFKSALNPSILR